MYCPKNIDIPAYEGYLKSCIASERERYAIAIARAEAHKAGYEEGISVALEGLRCSNYEKKLDDESYRQGINDFLYELGKELGIGSAGLREKNISLDEKAALMAEHIRLEFGAVAGDEGGAVASNSGASRTIYEAAPPDGNRQNPRRFLR